MFVILSALLVIFLPMIVTGKSLIWHLDGLMQHATFLQNFVQNGWLSRIGEFDFSAGLGADYLGSYSYYMIFDPFNVFLYLPFSVEFNYSLIIVLKFVLTAWLMFGYLKSKGISPETNIIASTLYMLGGFALMSYVRHPFFATGPMYLPLIIWGIDNILDGKRPYLLILGVVASIFSSFYFVFMSSVFAVVYTILKVCLDAKRKNYTFWSGFWQICKVGLWYLLGILISAVFLLPVAVNFIRSAKSQGAGIKLFNLEYFFSLAISANIMYPAGEYTPLFYTVAIFAIIAWSFRRKNPETKTYRVMLIVLAIGLFVPIVGYIFNFMNYVSNRWVYLLQFCTFVLVAYMLDDMKSNAIEIGDVKASNRVVLAELGLGLIFVFAYLFSLGLKKSAWLIALASLGIVAVCVAVVLLAKKIKSTTEMNKIEKRFTKRHNAMIITLVLTIVCAFGYNIGYSITFKHYGELNKQQTAIEKTFSREKETEFYRVDKQNKKQPYFDYPNRAVVNDYYSTYYYNTVVPAETEKFLEAVGVYNTLNMRGIVGLGNSVPLQALMSVKYYQSNGYVPYGFTSTTIDGGEILKNDNYVPFGFVYDKEMSSNEFDSLSYVERQYAMLEYAVVDKDVESGYTAQGVELPVVVESNEFDIDGTRYFADKGEKITLNISNALNKEVYLQLNHFESIDNYVYIIVDNSKIKYHQRIAGKGAQTFSGIYDYVYDLGVADSNNMTVTITCDSNSEFDLASFSAYGYDLTDFGAKCADLADEHMTDYKFDGNRLTGKVNMTNAGRVFLSIPNVAGWTAKVDGVEVKIDTTNVAFMSLKLDAGEHTIELNYRTPYLKQGGYISVVGLGFLGGFVIGDIIFTAVKKRKTRKTK
ncbi:MAG: YfhO family protein [Clostridia bacterium]|nr:YfhO family protein [Clostridia bacterium]